MSNCKRCLHYQMCIYSDGNKRCPCFTDRSEWVHLLYNVGDTVWYITGIHHTLIKSARVEEIIINETGVRELYVSTENGCYFQNDISTFYLTPEEAEKVIEKENKNES